jgi:hypothetical protein
MARPLRCSVFLRTVRQLEDFNGNTECPLKLQLGSGPLLSHAVRQVMPVRNSGS